VTEPLHVGLVILEWIVVAYIVILAVIFAGLMLGTAAAMLDLHWPRRSAKRMPTDEEWMAELARWEKEYWRE
jgi:hypothetical protein